MFGIGHLLKKMQNRQTREFFVRDIIKSVIKETINSDVSIDSIKIKESIVYFSDLNQPTRSEIFIKKQRLLESINKKQDIITIIDLR